MADLDALLEAKWNASQGASAPIVESNSLLDSLLESKWNAAQTSVGGEFVKGLTSPIQNIKGTVSGLKDIGVASVDALGGDVDAAKTAIRGVGGIGAGLAGAGAGASVGAMAGAPLAPFTFGLSVPIGGLIGGAVGGAAGLFGFNKVADAVEAQDITALAPTKQDIEQAAYNTGAGIQFGVAPKLVGSTVKGVGKLERLVKNAAKPATEAGQRLVAKNILETIDPELQVKLDEGLNAAALDDFAQYKNTAEIADSPALSTAEQALATQDPAFAAILTEKALARNLAREAAIEKVAPPSIIPDEVFGSLLKEKLVKKAGTVKEAISGLYEKAAESAVDSNIPLYKTKQEIYASKNKYFGEGAGAMPSELNALFDDLQSAKSNVNGKVVGSKPYEYLQNMRSRASELAYKYKVSGDKRASAVASDITKSIDNSIMKAATTGKGLSPEAAAAWLAGKESFAKMKQTFEQGDVAKVFKAKNPLKDSAVLDTILRDPEAAASFKTAIGNDPIVNSAVKGQIITRLIEKSTSASDGQLLNNKFNTFLNDKSGQMSKFFEPKHLKDLQKIADDLKSVEQIKAKGRLQMKGGSDTASKLNVAQYLKDSITKELGLNSTIAKAAGKIASNRLARGAVGAGVGASLFGMPGAVAGTIIGEGASGLLNKYTGRINQMIMEAAANPEFAADLLKTPNKAVVSKIEGYLAPKVSALKQEFVQAAALQNEEKKAPKAKKGSLKFEGKKQEEKPMISKKGQDLIKKWEGVKFSAYDDGGGVKTIGYGHTGRGVSKGSITKDEAEQLFASDLAEAEQVIDSKVKVPLTQNQKDALASLVFNIGETQFSSSTLLKKLNAGDYEAAADEFLKWRKDNGKVVLGLVKRRTDEKNLFLS